MSHIGRTIYAQIYRAYKLYENLVNSFEGRFVNEMVDKSKDREAVSREEGDR